MSRCFLLALASIFLASPGYSGNPYQQNIARTLAKYGAPQAVPASSAQWLSRRYGVDVGQVQRDLVQAARPASPPPAAGGWDLQGLAAKAFQGSQPATGSRLEALASHALGAEPPREPTMAERLQAAAAARLGAPAPKPPSTADRLQALAENRLRGGAREPTAADRLQDLAGAALGGGQEPTTMQRLGGLVGAAREGAGQPAPSAAQRLAGLAGGRFGGLGALAQLKGMAGRGVPVSGSSPIYGQVLGQLLTKFGSADAVPGGLVQEISKLIGSSPTRVVQDLVKRATGMVAGGR